MAMVNTLMVVRENGDTDELVLCRDCEQSVRDFLRITERIPFGTPARCDRCGRFR